MSINVTVSMEQAAQERIEAAWATGDALKLWHTLRNPDNTISRQHIRRLCPEAPPVRAAITVWRTFLMTRFPGLDDLLVSRQKTREADTQAKQARWHRESLYLQATLGPQWSHNGVTYPHALAFVEHLTAEGYVPETTGIGTVRFCKGPMICGPMRNKHLNAAVAYLALPPN